MAVYTRDKLPGLLKSSTLQDNTLFVLFGERYLCREAADQLEKVLLAAGGAVHSIDGDQEDIPTTLAKLRSYSLLPGRQLYRVTDTKLFHSKNVARNIWERAVKAQKNGKTEQAGRALRAFLESGGLDPDVQDNEPAILSPTEWQRCFGFAHPSGDLSWCHSCLQAIASLPRTGAGTTDPAEMLIKTLEEGIPENNVLMLLAEEVDKRKKLFKFLKEKYIVIDLSVETGASAKAQKEQKGVLQDLIHRTLAEQNKTMDSGLIDLFLERVGFYPVAVVMELRKVMLYIEERRQITHEDVNLLVGRTRQEALFELTTAISRGDLPQSLTLGQRLQENGIHPLAVIATLRNFVRGLLLCKALQNQAEVGFQPSMSAAAFQQRCLPLLKEKKEWKKEFSIHPYALYMQFKSAAQYPLPHLVHWLDLLLQTEFKLKGSPLEPGLLLHQLLVNMLLASRQKYTG